MTDGADNGAPLGVVIDGNIVYRNCLSNSINPGHNGTWGAGIGDVGNGTTIRDNNVYDNWGEGIDVGSGAARVAQHASTTTSTSISMLSAPHARSTAISRMRRAIPDSISTGRSTFSASLRPSKRAMRRSTGTFGPTTSTSVRSKAFGSSSKGPDVPLTNNLIANNTFVDELEGRHPHRCFLDEHGKHPRQHLAYRATSGALTNGSSSGVMTGHNCWFGATAEGFASASDVTADPQLSNPGQALVAGMAAPTAYQLDAGSPCLHSGQTLSKVPDDFWGTPRTPPISSGAFQAP